MTDPLAHLVEYHVPWKEIASNEVKAYADALDSAPDEAAMQKFLEENPRFLVQHLTARHGYWVIPSKRLGGEHITDFMIAELDGAHPTWFAVELERPQAKLFTKKGDPSAALTHALRQIDDWRIWLSHNRDYATRIGGLAGLGLTAVDPELEGLVIMGRDEPPSVKTDQYRRRLSRDKRVRIHTYDWLLGQASERLKVGLRAPHPIDLVHEALSSSWENYMGHTHDLVGKVFGGVASVSTFGPRSIEWKSVSMEVNGTEFDIVYDGVDDYGGKLSYSFGNDDWDEWLSSPGMQQSDSYTMLVTEVSVDATLISRLQAYDEGIWYSKRGRTLLTSGTIDVLLYLPISLEVEERMARLRRTRDFLEKELPKLAGNAITEMLRKGTD
jgi:hypothetical protein